MNDIWTSYLAAGAAAVELIARDEVAARWQEPSILEGYRVGGLTAHLGRALVTVETYLGQEPPAADAVAVDAVAYFAAVLGDHDPITSELHAQVRERSERAAADGHQALVENLRGVLARLEQAPVDATRPIAVLAGIAIVLEQYLMTRLVELTVHTHDLAASVGIRPTRFEADVWRVVAQVVAGVAVARNDPEAVVLALARPDRSPRISAF